MKVIFVAFLALAVGANAFPQDYELELENQQRSRIVENQIRQGIEDMADLIRANGLDPAQVLDYKLDTALQPEVRVRLHVKDSHMIGLSDIEIFRVSYSAITGRLIIEIGLPRISVSIGSAALSIDYHGDKYDGAVSGTLHLTRMRVNSNMRISVGIITGINVQSVAIDFTSPTVQSNLSANLQGVDRSQNLNDWLNVTLPIWLRLNKRAIDEFLSNLVKAVLEALLS